MSIVSALDVLAVMKQEREAAKVVFAAKFKPDQVILLEREANEARAAVETLIEAQHRSLQVLRIIVRDKQGGVHYAAANAACHEAAAALAGVGSQA